MSGETDSGSSGSGQDNPQLGEGYDLVEDPRGVWRERTVLPEPREGVEPVFGRMESDYGDAWRMGWKKVHADPEHQEFSTLSCINRYLGGGNDLQMFGEDACLVVSFGPQDYRFSGRGMEDLYGTLALDFSLSEAVGVQRGKEQPEVENPDKITAREPDRRRLVEVELDGENVQYSVTGGTQFEPRDMDFFEDALWYQGDDLGVLVEQLSQETADLAAYRE